MKIFYYTWYGHSETDLAQSLLNLGYDVVKCHIPFEDYDEDEEFTANLERIFQEQECELFISFDFFPNHSKERGASKETIHLMGVRYASYHSFFRNGEK